MKLLTLILVFLLICPCVWADRLAVTPGQSADDGQEDSDGYINIYFTYIEFVWDFGRRYGAIRFPNVTISQGATIDSSFMRVWDYSGSHTDARDTIACDDVDNAPAIDNGDNGNISDRWTSATTARVFWNEYINNSTSYTRIDCELKTLVQEIVNRPSWESGNAIMFLFKNVSDSDFEIYTWDHDDPTETVESLIVYYTVEEPSEASDSMRYKGDERFRTSFYDWRFQNVTAGPELRFGVQSIYSNGETMKSLENGEVQRIFVGKP